MCKWKKRFSYRSSSFSDIDLSTFKASSKSSEEKEMKVSHKALLPTNSLVEEFMLLANISVAAKIEEKWPGVSVLRFVSSQFVQTSCGSFNFRRHMPPPPTNFAKLQDILKKRRGLDLDVSSSGALAKSLDLCEVSHSERQILPISQVKRTHPTRNSTLSCESWPPVVCCLQSTSVRGRCQRRHLDTMD